MLFSNPVLTIVIILISLFFLLYAVKQVKQGSLLLRYSLLWLLLAILLLIVALWPDPIFLISRILGFNASSNFIFLIAIFFLLIISLTHARAISKQAIQTRKLIQRQAISDKYFRDHSVSKE